MFRCCVFIGLSIYSYSANIPSNSSSKEEMVCFTSSSSNQILEVLVWRFGVDQDNCIEGMSLWIVIQSWFQSLYCSSMSPFSENADLFSHIASVIGHPFHLM